RYPPFEGADAGDPPPLELERHPGARGFVGSGAIEDQLAIAGDVRQVLVERLHRDPVAVGNGIWSGGHVQRGAEVEDRDVLPGLELALEVLRRDPRDPETPEKQPSTQTLEEDIADEGPHHHEARHASQGTDARAGAPRAGGPARARPDRRAAPPRRSRPSRAGGSRVPSPRGRRPRGGPGPPAVGSRPARR